MKTLVFFAVVISSAMAFGPYSVPLVTKTTTAPIDCDAKETPFTRKFCEFKPERLFKHPHYPKWFISCSQRSKSVCQRCDPEHNLELVEECQMCLRPGEKCPDKLPTPKERTCKSDECHFCPKQKFKGDSNKAEDQIVVFAPHRDYRFYCMCAFRRPRCMPCPCGTIFDKKKKCCVPSDKNDC